MRSFSREILWILLAASLFFIPFLGHVHLFDWDEINFAECSREMIEMNDYTRVYIDFKPFWEKPPMFFWMQSTAMKIFGVNEFAARFPNAICGIATLIVLFLCGRKIYDTRFGILWALAYGGSFFPNLYFKSGIIDPWFNLFIFVSIYFFILYHWKRNSVGTIDLHKNPIIYVTWSGIFMGLAMLTKGQVALIMFVMAAGVYFLLNRLRFYFTWWHVFVYLGAMFIVTSTWYGYETIKNGPWFINEFLKYQYRLFTTHDAGQKGFFAYHYVVILIGCFPASVFAIRSFFKTPAINAQDKDFKLWMIILFWVVTILFTIVKSRIIHYSSLAWFPVTFMGAYTFYKWQTGEIPYRKYLGYLSIAIGSIIAFVLIAAPFFAMNIKKYIPLIKDPFAHANMEADVYWSGFESLIGVLLLISIITGVVLLNKRRFQLAAWTFFVGTAVVVFLASAVVIPKVERYSQGAAMDFFKERQGEDCYVTPLGYKTYGHLFYTLKKKPVNPASYDIEWLLHGPIDKPVYFVSKVDREDRFNQYTHLKELYRKNGFVFLKREK